LGIKISDKDKKVWQEFLSSKENITDKDKDSQSDKTKKRKTYSFDLHGYSLSEANQKVEHLINECYEKKAYKLILVTGKGLHSDNEKDPYSSKDLGILKHSVPDYIKNSSDLMKMINRIEEASIGDGGSGAFYIYFKKKL
tara:strand:+ start:786 stop:1205 length:420 start_codon:yes stop_codon:yes gene_type:complete